MNVCVVVTAEKHSPYVNIILLTAPEAFQMRLYFHYNVVSSLGSEFMVVELSESPESLDELLRASYCPFLCQETAGWKGGAQQLGLRSCSRLTNSTLIGGFHSHRLH